MMLSRYTSPQRNWLAVHQGAGYIGLQSQYILAIWRSIMAEIQ